MGRSFAALLGAFVLVAAACAGSAAPTTPAKSPAPSAEPTFATTQRPSPSPSLSSTPSPYPAAALPVHEPLAKHGPFLLLAPAPDGSLYVLIPGGDAAVLARLDRAGAPAPGWPVTLPHTTHCEFLAAAADGSIRAICDATDVTQPDLCCDTVRAFALDPEGQPLRGWPAEIDTTTAARVVGNDLVVLSDLPVTDTPAIGSVNSLVQLFRIEPDGGIARGIEVPMIYDGRYEDWAIGPDGIAYGLSTVSEGEPAPARVLAIDTSGSRAGWPVTLEANGSPLAFADDGRIVLLVGDDIPPETGARTPTVVAIEPADPAASPVSVTLPIELGYGVDCYDSTLGRRPLSRGDVTIVRDEMKFYAFDGRLRPLSGWPYEAAGYLQDWAYPPTGEEEGGLDCSVYASAALGPDGTVFVPLGAESETSGGSLVAVARSGKTVPGWPLALLRAGSGFWSVEVGPTGMVFAAAVEQEKGGLSATILGIAPDSTVLWRTTVLEP